MTNSIRLGVLMPIYEPTKRQLNCYHAVNRSVVENELATNINYGISDTEAVMRLNISGFNELKEIPLLPYWRLVLSQFQNFVVMILVVASMLSGLMGEWIEAGTIMAIVMLNATIGVIQESKAERALSALKQMSATAATVIRGGSHTKVPSRELVPGDIVILETGNYVPADVRLVETVNLRIEEAALTGESIPVEKDAAGVLPEDALLGDLVNSAFMGTIVTYGRAKAIVTGTGMNTQLGLIAEQIQSIEPEETPLQKNLDYLGKQLGTICLSICVIVFGVAVFNNTDLSLLFDPQGGLIEYLRVNSKELSGLFIIAVSLAIAAVPEGLPAVVTITLAIGMREMIKKNALVRRLSAVEALGSASVICSDKTGTLTYNSMTVVKIWLGGLFVTVSGEGYIPEGRFVLGNNVIEDLDEFPPLKTALLVGLLSSDASLEDKLVTSGNHLFRIVGDPTEGGLVVVAAKAGIFRESAFQMYPRLDELPFDSDRKCMSVVFQASPDSHMGLFPHVGNADPSETMSFVIAVKGAPDVVMAKSKFFMTSDGSITSLSDDLKNSITAAIDAMSEDALRVMAVGYSFCPNYSPEMSMTPEEIERDIVFVGLFGIVDPPRPEASSAILKAKKAGIRTVMITGDYPNTAMAVGRSIGLLVPGNRVISGAQLEIMDDAELKKALDYTDVFARVSPHHKVRIVDALRASGAVVSMTGDGVNDAPALKRADIGVAMGISGTDVAKETADMVLMDDNYVSIVSAVEQGRIIYSNIRKFVFFLFSSNVAEIMIIFLATLAGLPVPLAAVQLLWLNLVTDGAPALALALEKGDPDIMEQPPRPKAEKIVNRTMKFGIFIQMVAQSSAVLGAFVTGLYMQIPANIISDANPVLAVMQYNWNGVDVIVAQTMGYATLSLCELLRAFTVRSVRSSIFTIGFTSNPHLLVAVIVSIALTLVTIFVPFLQPIFKTSFLTVFQWQVVFALSLVPAVVEELAKLYLRKQNNV